MSAFVRGTVLGAGVVGAVWTGLYLKDRVSFSAEPRSVVISEMSTPPTAKTISTPPRVIQFPSVADRKEAEPPTIQLVSRTGEPDSTRIDFDSLPPPPSAKDEPDPNDLGFKIIKKYVGINTNVLGDPGPVPPVLADAKKNDIPPPTIQIPSPTPVPQAPPRIQQPSPTPLPQAPPTIQRPSLTPVPPPGTIPAIQIPSPSPLPPPGMIPDPMVGPTPRLDIPPHSALDVPEVPKPRLLVNSRDIALDFEVTKRGLSKIVAVELWTTRDGGQTWQATDRQAGSTSPFRTRLWSEGEYGFRMVFESESGAKTSEPKPGQNSDFCLVLDTTPPKVAMHRPESAGGKPGTVTLRWSVSEQGTDTLVGLEYSTDGAEWISIPNVEPRDSKIGYLFDWAIPAGVPSRVALRVTVRDQAGNIATAQTTEAVSIDLVQPVGKVTGIYKEGDKPDVGPQPREVEVGPMPRMMGKRRPELPRWRSAEEEAAERFERLVTINSGFLSDTELRRKLEDRPSEQRINLVSWLVKIQRPLMEETQDRPIASVWQAYSGPQRPLLELLTDPNWKPSTATPESYRTWETVEPPQSYWGPGPSGIEFVF